MDCVFREDMDFLQFDDHAIEPSVYYIYDIPPICRMPRKICSPDAGSCSLIAGVKSLHWRCRNDTIYDIIMI